MRASICETLSEVAEAMAAGAEFRIAFGNFLAFLREKDVLVAIERAPRLLAGRHSAGAVVDAYLAAAAEYLAQKNGLDVPGWAQESTRFLSEFNYPSKNKRLNDLLALETPEPFRRRGIIVSSNAMEVA